VYGRVHAHHDELSAAAGRGAPDHPHGRGLPSSVGAEEAEDLSWENIEVDAVDCCQRPEALGEGPRVDESVLGWLRSCVHQRTLINTMADRASAAE
jgi:hypothetical protein